MFLDFLKRKKKKAPKAKEEEKTAEKSGGEKGKVIAPVSGNAFSFRIIKQPHISEKSSSVSERGQYVFRVCSKASKVDIKRGVEKMYNVKVQSVSTLYALSKKRQVGKYEGESPGYKKAVVRLKKGHKIDIMPR